MLINRQTDFQWQLILVTDKDPELILKTGTLLLALNHQAPLIQPCNTHVIDLLSLSQNDIIGTCGLATNSKVTASLKFLCINILNGSHQPDGWTELINNVATTSAVHFFSYIKCVQLARTQRMFINAFIAKKRSTEFDKAVFYAKSKELFLQFEKYIVLRISLQRYAWTNNQSGCMTNHKHGLK